MLGCGCLEGAQCATGSLQEYGPYADRAFEEKGWLSHRDGSNGFFYSATVPRDEVQRSSIQKLIDTVFNGSAESLVLTLLNGGPLSQAEADRIRQLIGKTRGRKS